MLLQSYILAYWRLIKEVAFKVSELGASEEPGAYSHEAAFPPAGSESYLDADETQFITRKQSMEDIFPSVWSPELQQRQ
ncbi:unnamed protein product [Arabidopsis arenosa]|uniref:Uncharacterized protein n=1 Tax=Arabidopsis arenosa TaxID=38785 RepID=A0A8S2AYA3_ARAAE|nr:unnamed protein product [Arabidopsis arenosa]